jgi:hypothetical protein
VRPKTLLWKIFPTKEGKHDMTNDNGLSETPNDVPTVVVTAKYLDDLRKAVGLHLDPETADVEWVYAQTLDPYGDNPNLPEESRQVGREYFARCPEIDVWIWFGDLPDTTRDALWAKHKSRLAFPAGLEFIGFAHQYLEQHVGPVSELSIDQLGEVMTAAYEAYLAETTEREDGDLKGRRN